MDEEVQDDTEDEEGEETVSLRTPEAPEEAEVEEEAVEAQVPRAARAPHVPSQQEIDEHDLTHCPYRAWCEHCVRGQAKDDCHSKVAGIYADSSVVRVSMDYCFLTEDVKSQETEHNEEVKANVSMTILVMAETLCRSIWAYAVRSKGATETWMVEQIVEDLETIGLSNERIILKADQETSMTDIQQAVAKLRKGHGSAIEQSRVGDSNSNGRIERAIQDLKGLIRTLRSALEAKIGSKIQLSDPIVPFMVRHAAHIINVSRVREDGRTAWQNMKGRRSNTKILPFGEVILFKIPKTKKRIGSFEDRWEEGCWIGVVPRSGEHLVAAATGVYKVSTIKRRPADKRWSGELIRGIVGSPDEPVPGSGSRRLQAYAKKVTEAASGPVAYAPAPEVEEPEVRAAKVTQKNVEEHGGSDRCPGCTAIKHGKYRAKHTTECRQRFERILQHDAKAKQRFERATERRLQGITKKAMEMHEEVEEKAAALSKATQEAAKATAATSGPSSGSGMTDHQRRSGVDDQNEKALQEGIKASVAPPDEPNNKKRGADATADDSERMARPQESPRGKKRNATEEADDQERTTRADAEEKTKVKGVKRKGDEQGDDSRAQDRSDDMSSLAQHPGLISCSGRFAKEDLEWKHIGSGMFARTFPQARYLVTTTKGGPKMKEVHRRTIRSLTTGKVIDDCIVEDTPEEVLHKRMKNADSIRVELTMKGALRQYEAEGWDVAEVYSQPRIAQEASLREYGGTQLMPGWSLDLTLNDPLTQKPWDLGKNAVRDRIRKLVVESKPFIVIGAPPRPMFSPTQNLRKKFRNQGKFEERLEVAKKHVKFCLELYKIQLKEGRHFVHKHPNCATSWLMPEVMALANMTGVMTTTGDTCAYGLKAQDEHGEAKAQKRLRFLTSSPEVCKRISRQCTNRTESGRASVLPLTRLQPKLQGGVSECVTGQHQHANLMSGRAKQCQIYSREFCREVCEGIAAQKRLDSLGLRSEPILSFEGIRAFAQSKELHDDEMPPLILGEDDELDQPKVPEEDEEDNDTIARDDVSGAPLKPELVIKARQEEMEYFRKMGVYCKVSIEECRSKTGKGPIGVRWIDINKGDEHHPNYRSRLVAKEFKTDINPELYAATPPSECLRLMISILASQEGAEMMYADVSRAYFYAKAVRPVYVKLPDEDYEEGDERKCARLLMSMYGTRDAAANWAAEYTATLLEHGFIQGEANSCLFQNPVTKTAVMVHGDDFVAVGSGAGLKKTREALENKYCLKVQTLGSRAGCDQEIRVLNKIIRYTPSGIELEADPRHAERVIRDLGLEEAKASRVPGVKEHNSGKGRYEDEGTADYKRRKDLLDKAVAMCMACTGPLTEEQKKQVGKLLEEAREMPIPRQAEHEEHCVGGWMNCHWRQI